MLGLRYIILDYQNRQLLASNSLEEEAKPLVTISTKWARVTRASGVAGSNGALSFFLGQPDLLLNFLCSDNAHREAWVQALETLIDGAAAEDLKKERGLRDKGDGNGDGDFDDDESAEPVEVQFTFDDAQLGLKLVNEEDYCRVSGFLSDESASKLMGVKTGDFVVEVNGVRTCP